MTIEGKTKLLFKNTGILAIGTLLSKVLTFFLLPIYTSYLSTNDYGYVDLLQTIATLLLPIISLEIYCAIFRFIIEEKEKYKVDKIISTSFFINLITTGLFVIITLIMSLCFNFQHLFLFCVYFVSLLSLTNLQFTIRGFGNNKLFSFVGFLNTLIALTLNILFIVIMHLGAVSILIALTIGNIISIVIIALKTKIVHSIKFKNFSKSVAKKIICYSLPLIPNDISWWIANTSDRLIISKFISLSANGIYAVANKIPLIYTTVFGVFNTAWVESVSRGINDNNSKKFINEMYKSSFKLFSCICIGIICATSIFFNFIISNEYAESYSHIYILTIAIFFNSLSSLIGSILTGYKKTKIIGKTTIIGAVVNIIINITLINKIGLFAASISTLVSYIIIFLIRNYEINKIQKIEYPIPYFIPLFINIVIVSIGFFCKIKFLNYSLLIYLIVFTYFVNRELINKIIKQRKDDKIE